MNNKSIKNFKSLKEVYIYLNDETAFNELIKNIQAVSESNYSLKSIAIFINDKNKLDSEFSHLSSNDEKDFKAFNRNKIYYNFETFVGKEYKHMFSIRREITKFSQIPKKCNIDNLKFMEDSYYINGKIVKPPKSEEWIIEHLELKLIK